MDLHVCCVLKGVFCLCYLMSQCQPSYTTNNTVVRIREKEKKVFYLKNLLFNFFCEKLKRNRKISKLNFSISKKIITLFKKKFYLNFKFSNKHLNNTLEIFEMKKKENFFYY